MAEGEERSVKFQEQEKTGDSKGAESRETVQLNSLAASLAVSFQESHDIEQSVKTDFLKVASLRHGWSRELKGTAWTYEGCGCFKQKSYYDVIIRNDSVSIVPQKQPRPAASAGSQRGLASRQTYGSFGVAMKEKAVGSMDIGECEIQACHGNNNVRLYTGDGVYEVRCRTPEECAKWMKAVEETRSNSIMDYYSFGDEIGKGSFASVHAAKSLETGDRVAVKILQKSKMPRTKELHERELAAIRNLNHPNVVRTTDIFETVNTLYFVMEYMECGDMAYLYEKSVGEELARKYMTQIIRGVAYIHGKRLVHRDLKPQNLLTRKGEDGELEIKLSDFGLATFIDERSETRLHSRVGTALFLAPEIIKAEAYDEKVDIWSCGVLLHFMLFGKPPFLAKTKIGLFEHVVDNLRNKDAAMIQKYPQAMELVNLMLAPRPDDRPSAAEIREHPWLAQ